MSFLKAMRPRTDMSYGCIAVSMTGPSRFRSEITSNCNKYCSAGNLAEKVAGRSETRYVRVFDSRPVTLCAEAGIDIVAQALGEQAPFMLNVSPCGFGGISTDLRGGGVFLLPCYGPALSQTGRCDPQTSGAQIQKVIDSAVNMAALQARWPVVWAKAQLLLNSSGIEDYCRKPFGGPADPIARWQDNCANMPRGDPFP
jgi:hypothetical protein